MRLVKSLERVERNRAAAGSLVPRGKSVGLIWSDDEQAVALQPGPGEYVATDLWTTSEDESDPHRRTVERLTRDRLDLGNVFGPDGSLIGRVKSIRGSLLTFEWARAKAGA